MKEIELVILWLGNYAVGCICFGYYLVKYITHQDIRKLYSGTVGATNVGRILGQKWMLVVLLLDSFKSYLAMSISNIMLQQRLYSESSLYYYCLIICLFGLMLGHIFPLQLYFRGGKGISVFIGGMMFLLPLETSITLVCYVLWICIYRDTKFIRAIAMTFFLVLNYYFTDNQIIYYGIMFMMLIIIIVHFLPYIINKLKTLDNAKYLL